MEDEIRSYSCRLARFDNVYFTFSKSLSQRLEDRTTTLSTHPVSRNSRSSTSCTSPSWRRVISWCF